MELGGGNGESNGKEPGTFHGDWAYTGIYMDRCP